MMDSPDPVDHAMYSLRSEAWTAQPLTFEKEKHLMQKAHAPIHDNFRMVRRVLVALVAIIAVAGGALAATQGVGTFRTWLFDIEVGPETNAKILVADGQSGTMIIEREDGSITEIEAKATGLEEGGARANVTVRTLDGRKHEEDVHEVIRQRGPAPLEVADISVLENAKLLTSWTDGADRVLELYVSSVDDESRCKLYVVVDGFEPLLRRRIIASPEVRSFIIDVEPVIAVDDEGSISIKFNAGDEVAVFKWATRPPGEDDEASDASNEPIVIEGRDGELRVRIQSDE